VTKKAVDVFVPVLPDHDEENCRATDDIGAFYKRLMTFENGLMSIATALSPTRR